MKETAGKVLVVEDNLAILYALRAQFSASGWSVSESRTVASALPLLDPPPDWIILDLWLADGDGEEVLRHVRRLGIASRVAILSAALDPERITSLARLSPDLVMPKPVGFAELLAACRGVESDGSAPPLDRMLQELREPSSPPRTGPEILSFAG